MNPSKTSYPTFLIVTAVYNLVFLVVFLVIFYIWNYTEFNGSGLSYKTGELIGMIGAGVMAGV
ncbi:MAG TPA: hypothetical protein VHS96_03720, partial [Bacteroidia bacterium]|nr:hypothetical protein [Bacteroidia bacterium]